MDDLTRSAIARGKPISAARAQALVEEIERLRRQLAETQALNQAMREELARVQEVARRALGG
jgi:hypothetical protein